MAVKASVTITISKYRDTSSITRYYKLQASTASKPAKPTTLTPSGWTDTEPTYTSGSTNTLYFVDRYVFSDGTFQYTEVSKSTSYEAAKEAYNKAQAAQNGATSANNKIDNLQIGGRNLLFSSKLDKATGNENWLFINLNTVETKYYDKNELAYLIKTPNNGHIENNGVGFLLNAWNRTTHEQTRKTLEPGETYTFSIDIKGKIDNTVSNTGKLGFMYNLTESGPIYGNIFKSVDIRTTLLEDKYKRYTMTFTVPTKAIYEFSIQFFLGYNGNIYIKNAKLEKGNKATDWTPAPEDIEGEVNDVSKDLSYFKETTFATYKREQEINDQGIKNRLSRTEVTVYGDPEDPDDPKALINHVQKVDNDLNGAGGAIDRIEAAEGTIDGTGLNEYDQRIKISQRFLDIETDVESIKNIFNMTGGTNLVQNSVGYFASNNKPTMWDITSNTIYTPFGYDGDLTGITVSRGRLFCAKGSIKTTANNIIALLSNKMISVSFKYKNGANAISKIKIFNGSTVYFEKTFNTTVNQWTEYRFNPNTDPVLANPTFLNTSNSLQISIESTNSTNNNGFEISDLMLNYGNVKPWELSSNEVYGAMVKLSSLGIEVTATTANTKNFMTTDGILVYRYDSKTDKIIGTEPITKITDNGTVTNKLESTGDIIERNLIHTMIKDSSNNDVYVEYIR